MNKIKNNKSFLYASFASLVMCVFVVSSSLAHAQSNQEMGSGQQGMQGGMQMPPMPGGMQQGGQGGDMGPRGMGNASGTAMYRRMPNGPMNGSSTMSSSSWGYRMMNGSTSSTTGMRRMMPMMSASSSMLMPGGRMINGIVGTVSDVESSYLLVEGQGRENASTTYTVNVTASTTYSDGSSTSSLADVSVGTTVFVIGPLSTSTDTVTANHILIGAITGRQFNRGPQGVNSGTSTNNMNNMDMGGMGQGMNPPSSQKASNTPPQSSGFIGKVFHKLFGWL